MEPKTRAVRFPRNVQQQLVLASAVANIVRGRARYALADGRALVVALHVRTLIDALELHAGETFCVCKRSSGNPNQTPRWEVWRGARSRAFLGLAIIGANPERMR
jgi:hypothetical protein